MLNITGKRLLALSVAALVLIGAGTAQAEKRHQKETAEEDLGLRKESLYEEEKVRPEHGEYAKAEPGKSKRIERAFENSPPLVPHDITGMLPIAETNNICMGCHMPVAAPSTGATPIPKSHLVNLKTGEDLKGKLDLERYNCIQCHVSQVDLTPPVKSTFKSAFRDRKGKTRSNLFDTLNEGVGTE